MNLNENVINGVMVDAPARFQTYHLSQKANIITSQVPGPRSSALLKRQQELEGKIVSYPIDFPVALDMARGAVVQDVDGNQFIDFFSMAGVLNLGHCNPDIIEAVQTQQSRLVHALDFPTHNKLKLIENILSALPEQWQDEYKVNFCASTGSDAIEAAIKLAKHKTGRETIIAFQGGYHGMTSGALSLSSNLGFRNKLNGLIPGVHFVPYSYCYRCPFGKNPSDCKMDCVDFLESLLLNPHSGINKPAAVILEPIQGEGGIVVPQNNYLIRLLKICRKHEILLIVDEIQSGFFRTGNFLACSDMQDGPDIITMSKGLGGIGFPISAIVYRKEIEAWGKGDHIGTFRGNQVSIAAGNAAFEFVKTNAVESYVMAIGHYLIEKLRELQTHTSSIGEIRGKGLFVGIEFVKNRDTREPDPDMATRVKNHCFRNGLLVEVGGHYNNVLRILPPLIITRALLDNGIDILSDAVHSAERLL